MKKLPSRVSKRKLRESTRDATLRILKLKGESSVVELCKSLNLTHTAVRRCLAALQHQGLVEYELKHQEQGRPTHSYKLTVNSSTEFPNGYEQLSRTILDTLFQRGGHAAVMDFLKANNDSLIARLVPQYIGKTLKERVELVVDYFNDNGYMSGWMPTPDGNIFVYNQNCAIYNLASQYRQFCVLEPRLIESLLGYKIVRQQYILKGQPVCGYMVDTKRPLIS